MEESVISLDSMPAVDGGCRVGSCAVGLWLVRLLLGPGRGLVVDIAVPPPAVVVDVVVDDVVVVVVVVLPDVVGR